MQLWVSQLKQKRGRIALIILSVAIVLSCFYGVATAWFNHVEQSNANVGMEVQYINIFTAGTGDGGNIQEYIPGKSYTIDPASVGVDFGETEGKYCVFVQMREIGGNSIQHYFDLSKFDLTSNWKPFYKENQQEYLEFIAPYQFPVVGKHCYYFYQVVNAENVVNGRLEIIDSTNNILKASESTTYSQVQEIQGEGNEVKLSLIVAGCKIAGDAPTPEEVLAAEVYTAFL